MALKTPKEIEDKIIKDYYGGIKTPVICQKYNINSSTIYYILKRNNLKDKGGKTYKLNENAMFNKIDCWEKAYFLGWIYSDGCLHGNGLSVILNLGKKDQCILNYFNNFFFNGTRKIYTRKSNGTVSLVISDRLFYKQLESLDLFPNKSLTIKFPHKHLLEEYIRPFMQGLFEGNGCISISLNKTNCVSKKYTFKYSGNEDMCEGFRLIISKYTGIELSKPKKSKVANCYSIATAHSLKIKKIAEWLYEGSQFKLERKFDKFPVEEYSVRKKTKLKD